MIGEQLKAVHEARPFRPFTIQIADGSSVAVTHPEILWQTKGGRTIFVNTRGEEVTIIDLLLVTKITLGDGQRGPRRR